MGKELESSDHFVSWGHLKTDMLRRRFDKVYGDTLKELRKRGLDLDAIGETEMTEIEKKVSVGLLAMFPFGNVAGFF